jgi:hypothetical protein
MRRLFAVAVTLLVIWLMTVNAYGAALPADANNGVTLWALIGATPELAKTQELRLGYEGLLPGIELAVGTRHLEAPDTNVDDWSVRGYVLAHALDTKMVASVLGNGMALPDGNIYAGLFVDRQDSWSGGYAVGGLVDWPKRWQTVAEYSTTIWNSEHDSYAFVLGLRKKF